MALTGIPQYDPNSTESAFDFIVNTCKAVRESKLVEKDMEEMRERLAANKVYAKRAPRTESTEFGGARVKFKR